MFRLVGVMGRRAPSRRLCWHGNKTPKTIKPNAHPRIIEYTIIMVFITIRGTSCAHSR
jgi:hypothetical protein